MVNARSGNIQGVGAACCAVCVDAMGKLMMTNHWPLEAETIVDEQKAKVKHRVRAWRAISQDLARVVTWCSVRGLLTDCRAMQDVGYSLPPESLKATTARPEFAARSMGSEIKWCYADRHKIEMTSKKR